MKPLSLIIPLVSILLSCTEAGNRAKGTSSWVSRADSVLQAYTAKGDYASALSHAIMLDSLSVEKDDKEGRLLAAAYIGQCYLAMDQYDSCSIYFARGKEIWDAIKSHEPGDNAYKAVYVLHNSLGICAVNIENDYEKAMLHFTEGAKTASERGDTYYNIIFLSNMAVVCNIREDTSGIKYALEIYEYGRKTSDTSLISNGAYLSAMFYSKENELEKARDMLGKSLELTPKEDPRYGEMLNLYAEIFFKEGKTEDAEKYF